jgi:hypothetical protein
VGVGRNTTTTTTKALRIEQALSIEYGASKIARWGMKRGWRRTGCCGDPISSHVVPPKCSYKMHFSHDLRMKRLARFSLCVCVCCGIYKLSRRLSSGSAIMWMGGWVLCLQDRVRREFFAKKVEEMLLLRTQQRDLIFEVVGFLISFPHSHNSLQILPS